MSRIQLLTTENDFYQQINIRGPIDHQSFTNAFYDITGLNLPQNVNEVNKGDKQKVIALGPDEWLYVSPHHNHGLLEQLTEMQQTLRQNENINTSIVDVSHARDILLYEGDPQHINKFCPLDLRERSFPVETACQTVFAHVDILLYRHGSSSFEIYVLRSMRPHIEYHINQ